MHVYIHTSIHTENTYLYRLKHLHRPEVFTDNKLQWNIHRRKSGIKQYPKNPSKQSLLKKSTFCARDSHLKSP